MKTIKSLAAAGITTSVVVVISSLSAPLSHADNARLNKSVVANIYTIHRQAGCVTADIGINQQLQLAAQWHTEDVLNNPALDGDIGSDGSTAQQRANAAGFRGQVAETVAIDPALAINGIEILNQWFNNPGHLAIMHDCANTLMGVRSGNHLDRSVVVAVYGKPADDGQ